MKRFFLILSACCILTTVDAQWVHTVAGVLETPGWNDGPALSSRFNNPHGIAVDSVGVAYIADRYNHTIRKYDPISGEVSTLAGKPSESGDIDGSGEEARFFEPWGLCVTPDGIVYVADTKNNKIKKVTPDGAVTTIAGTGNFGSTDGPAMTSTFGDPTGIEVDPAGNVYVADHLTHIIRKLSSDGEVTTIAGFPYIPGAEDGTGSDAKFWRPYGLTLDNNGNIIVADEWNHKIRRVTPDGEVTTVAGTGEAGIANGTAAIAQFQFPWDITVDGQGNIFVADGFNYVIRKITPNGDVTSLAGVPQTAGGSDGYGDQASFSGATALHWNKLYNAIYVGDAYNHLVRVVYLDEPPSPSLWIVNLTGSEVFCEGDLAQFQANPIGYNEYKFYLNGELVQESSNPQFSITDMEAGTYEVQVAASHDGEIITSNLAIITVSPMPEPTISAVGPLSFYEGDSVILIANGTGEFLWSNASSEQTITITESGTYFVEETVGGCTGVSDEVQVDVTPLPDEVSITLDGEQVLCPGESARLVSSSSTGNQWLLDGWPMPGETAESIEVSEGGIYQVQVTDPTTGITAISEELEITTVPNPDFDFEATPRQGLVGQAINFESTGSDSPSVFLWDFGDPSSLLNTSSAASPSHVYSEEGAYTVTLIGSDALGCTDTVTKVNHVRIGIETLPVECEFFLPSAFTPNGDGENDVFRVRGAIPQGEFFMAIYNQWGEPLYSSEEATSGWDGTRRGQQVHSGTYVYLVEVETPEGIKQMTGYVTLIR